MRKEIYGLKFRWFIDLLYIKGTLIQDIAIDFRWKMLMTFNKIISLGYSSIAKVILINNFPHKGTLVIRL